jgi:hypothetical protein
MLWFCLESIRGRTVRKTFLALAFCWGATAMEAVSLATAKIDQITGRKGAEGVRVPAGTQPDRFARCKCITGKKFSFG